MVYLIAMGAGLYASWLLLSGHYTTLLVSFGVASTVLVVYLARRMGLVDRESVPLHVTLRAIGYVPWLAWEILKANVQVAMVILRPRLQIEPVLATYNGTQKTDLGRFVFANSVTLTPGTITVSVSGTEYRIHALTNEAITGTEEGEMDRRVTRLEGQ